MLTVGDADVLNEMATGWRASIRDLNTVDDRLKAGINGLRDHDQLGEATRDAAVGAFRDMRGYVAEQRLMLGQTAQALDFAGGAVSQVKSLIRAWDRAGVPVAPGPAPVPDPAAADQTAYWNQAHAHRQASDGYAPSSCSSARTRREVPGTRSTGSSRWPRTRSAPPTGCRSRRSRTAASPCGRRRTGPARPRRSPSPVAAAAAVAARPRAARTGPRSRPRSWPWPRSRSWSRLPAWLAPGPRSARSPADPGPRRARPPGHGSGSRRHCTPRAPAPPSPAPRRAA